MFYKILLTTALVILTTGCKDSYLGGLVQRNAHGATDSQYTAYDAEEGYISPGKRKSVWGECDYWREFNIQSRNDVDTAYIKLQRYQVTDTNHLPQGSNAVINRHIAQYWLSPEYQTGLLYKMPPRFSIVKVKDFEQKGLVSYQVSKNNTGSLIDVAYCVGVQHKLGFYIPHTIEPKFETTLRLQFEHALRR